MNIQLPLELLGYNKSIVLNTDDSFYQLTARYQSANITITLNNNEIEFYSFKIANFEGTRKVKEVLPKLIDYFEKLGYKDAYKMREKWKI